MDSNKCYSYVMGINDSILKLKEKGFKIQSNNNDYEVIFNKELSNEWENFIKNNLEEEYWNEYISKDNIIFIFHLKEGFKKYIVKDFNNNEVLNLCEKLCNCKFESIEKMIKDNSFYNKVYNTRIATRCYLIKDNKIVTIKYKNKGEKAGYYDLPGGKVEKNETSIECAKREILEETGLTVDNLKYSGNLIINYPDRSHDFSLYISNKFEENYKETIENEVEFIDINELLNKEKKFGCISLLEEKYINDLLNTTNNKYEITMDNNENIISINKTY